MPAERPGTPQSAEDTASPERDQTDKSLQAERSGADRELAEKRRLDLIVDRDVGQARASADSILEVARDTADQSLDAASSTDEAVEAMTTERALEDHILKDERQQADQRLKQERRSHASALASFLPDEREKTDRFLTQERARSDDDLANRDDFLGMVSHDLRNLLSGISLNASLLSSMASDASEEGRGILDRAQRIQRQVARMERLVADLVDVVSIDAGKLAVRPRSCEVGGLMAEVVEAYGPAANDKGLTLTLAPRAPLLGQVDGERMLQVLTNLVSNAVKFTPAGGCVSLDCERSGGELRISVIDTGIGIPADQLEAIFERFWQVGPNDRRGLGLGLYISRCIVEAHGGRIWAESRLGHSSAFHVVIPQ